jgi:hypothetical protein
MLTTLVDGFLPAGVRDELRGAPMTEDDLQHKQKAEDQFFEQQLPATIQAVQAERRTGGLPVKADADVEYDLRLSYDTRKASMRRGARIGDRMLPAPKRVFKKWLRSMVIDAMTSTLAATFYACDYSTKPNMVCASILACLRDGLKRLEACLQWENEQERLEELEREHTNGNQAMTMPEPTQAPAPPERCALTQELEREHTNTVQTTTMPGPTQPPAPPKRRTLTKLEREASRRLLRQATAIQQAQVKGHCLMVMHMLTGREVLRSHYPWQLMMKNPVWRAIEHRYRLDGIVRQAGEGFQPVTMLEVEVDVGEGDQAIPGDVDGRASSDGSEAGDSSCSRSSGEGESVDDGVDPAADGGLDAAPRPVLRTKARAAPDVRLRRLNDNYYEDYLHRGSFERAHDGSVTPTPLADMSLLDYGAFVRIVQGDPWELKPYQYAFDTHHVKFETYVQELRVGGVTAPVAIPFIQGFTMPTATTGDGLQHLLLSCSQCLFLATMHVTAILPSFSPPHGPHSTSVWSIPKMMIPSHCCVTSFFLSV